jgi:plastocyanin
MKYGRLFATLFAVLLFGAACSKGTTTTPDSTQSGSDITSQQSGTSALPAYAGGGQGTAQEEGSEGTAEAGGEGDTQAGTSGSVTLIAGAGGQMAFSPSDLSVGQGQTLVVRNAGSVQHTFTVTGQGIDVTLQPGQSQRVTIDLAPGEYKFFCSFHQSMGMTGTLTVA